ncbi:MAG: TM2 domain-containing protein [Planctomycetes bacterium]|nr:TM2 domain-containing protein [Planctomycetota bacterium]
MSSAPSASPPNHPRPWEDKNPVVAGVLAYLIPGAGHLYQGRTAKGLIYCLSILGLFFWGQKLGEGMVVYNLPEKTGPLRYVALSYAAQLGIGASALPALVQNRRVLSDTRANKLTGPLSAPFQGTLSSSENPEGGVLVGTVKFDVVDGQFGQEIHGSFEGTLDGQPTKLELGGGRFEIDRPIKAGFRRMLHCNVVESDTKPNTAPRYIKGSIPRPFINAYGSPPDPDQLQEINGRLGKIYELALVFTWIAGLLNVLAIWDCVMGPAYGFGDEHPAAPAASRTTATSSAPPVSPQPAATPETGPASPAQKSPA